MDSNFLKVYTKHLTASQAKNEHPLPSVSALVTMYIYIYILQKCTLYEKDNIIIHNQSFRCIIPTCILHKYQNFKLLPCNHMT